jgi:glucose-1-phosphate thymidylyltransferase
MSNRIGIIMAGGKGTRLYPLTKVINKHLLPVHDKPMIYYPLSTLIKLGHKTIYLITTKESVVLFKKLLGNGKNYGIKLIYKIQNKPNGIAGCFYILRKQIKNKKTTLILGDNLFVSNIKNIKKNINQNGCTLILTTTKKPQHYGVATVKNNKITNLVEKPKKPKSNFIATGLYFYDKNLLSYLKRIEISKRGEYEITDLNKEYINQDKCYFHKLARTDYWFDLGQINDLNDCSNFLKNYKKKSSKKLGNLC